MLTSRIFDTAGQQRFAAVTGDVNPMHMDPVAARRTQAGAPVVHGVHSLLWLLDGIAAQHPDLPPIAALKVKFARMVYVGDRAEAKVSRLTASALRAEVTVEGVTAVQLTASFGECRAAAPVAAEGAAQRPTVPLEPEMAEMERQSGRLSFAAPAGDIAALFPAAAALIGTERVAALGCSSYLVGMALPGLHSIYAGLALDLCPIEAPADQIAYRGVSVDPRFRMLRIEVSGGGLCGSLDTFIRHPPTRQAPMDTVAASVAPDAFAGATAFVVGGSRGLGELTAKIVAAGGGRVIISHASGKSDAERLAAEIIAWGGRCDCVPFDATRPAGEQLAALPAAPTHLYYFATPTIFRRKAGVFSRARLAELDAFYVSGFHDLIVAAAERCPGGIRAFYPSTVFVEDRPDGMTEYAMSKAAGEILCADINKAMANVHVVVRRLPRLATDQTAGIIETETADPLAVMLQVVRDVQGSGT